MRVQRYQDRYPSKAWTWGIWGSFFNQFAGGKNLDGGRNTIWFPLEDSLALPDHVQVVDGLWLLMVLRLLMVLGVLMVLDC